MKGNIKIIIAVHKNYPVPNSELYLPLHVGAEGKGDLGFEKDNKGENISCMNPYFCELTGMYWAWKNLQADNVGLVHYRRYFAGGEKFVVNGKTKKILSQADIDAMGDVDVILPKKRNYYIETLYSHYKHTMFIEPLDTAGEIIKEKCAEYLPEFEKLKKRRSAHMFNMLIMKKDIFDAYCTWLFDILFELRNRVDEKIYDSFHARFYGRVSELLLDVWLNTNKIKYKEVKLIGTEKTNWFKKGLKFLKAKFTGEKYDKSF